MDSGVEILLMVMILIFHGTGSLSYNGSLVIDYYKERCPLLEKIVQRNVAIAVIREPRMAASLLRLHFHDCFVLGCDASVLLDNSEGIVSEKQAGPNKNSLRGFEVIDEIKERLEEACPQTVSCADILALAARDAVVARGGRRWNVYFGRRDSVKASLNDANKLLPAPNSSLETLVANFQKHGLDTRDLVALSGSHTLGKARCVSFRQGIYQEEQLQPHKRDTSYQQILRSICPQSGRDDAFAPLDSVSPARFDNFYFHNIIQGQGLLISDNVLVSEDVEGDIKKHVWNFASDQDFFYQSFGNSMIKMGGINVLTGEEGEIRRNCSQKDREWLVDSSSFSETICFGECPAIKSANWSQYDAWNTKKTYKASQRSKNRIISSSDEARASPRSLSHNLIFHLGGFT